MVSIFARLITFLATISLCHAHYVFVRLAHNGAWKAPGQYIRNRTAPFIEGIPPHPYIRYFSSPTFGTDAPQSIRCGRDNLAHSGETETLKVKAGDTIEWVVTTLAPVSWNAGEVTWEGCEEGRGICGGSLEEDPRIYHRGAVVMHLSRVPDGTDVKSYDGSGKWVKFYTLGLVIDKSRPDPIVWLSLEGGKYPTRIIGTIPKKTPAGKYLLRVDQVYYGAGFGDPQFYPSCAHIEVESEASEGGLPEGIKIPEGMDATSPGIIWTNEYNPLSAKGYPYPGGPLWDGDTFVQDWSPKVV